jgi:hypothetical protein
VPDAKSKTVFIVSAYKSKNNTGATGAEMLMPSGSASPSGRTSETMPDVTRVAYNANVSQPGPKVNTAPAKNPSVNPSAGRVEPPPVRRNSTDAAERTDTDDYYNALMSDEDYGTPISAGDAAAAERASNYSPRARG